MATRRALNVPITADTSGLKKGVREADQELGKLEGSAKRTGSSLVSHIGDAGGKAGQKFKAGIAPLAGIAAAAGVAAGAALTKGIVERLDVEEAQTKLRVQLGLTQKESARFGRLSGQLFASNYGDSLGEVNDALKNVVSNIDGMRKESGSRLKGITGDVIQVAKAFDQDLGGVTRAVGQQMRTGLAKDAQEALNTIVVGFQHGADKSGDFLDTLNEYGTQFRKVGIDGKTATGLISQGLQAGARDADIVADAIKEFSIRAVDGSQTTADGFKAIGLNAQDMAERIGKGGKSARGGLDEVLDRLRAIKDPVKQSQVAVQLFGTQAEDLGDALYALDPSRATDAIGKVGGAARKLNQEMGATPKSQIETFWRTLQSGGTNALQKVTPLLGKGAAAATDFIKGMRDGSGAGGEFGQRVSKAVDRVKGAVSSWVSKNRDDINSVVNAFKTVGRFAKDVFLDTLLPIVRRTVEGAAKVIGELVGTIRGVVRLVSGLLSGDWDKAWSGAKETVSHAFKAIVAALKVTVGNLWEIVKDLGPDLIKLILKGLNGIGHSIAGGIVAGIEWAVKNVPGMVVDSVTGLGKKLIGWLTPGGDGLGKAFGDGVGASLPRFGGGLMGANPAMAPIAGIASRFGLGVSSGLRPGAITSSGNPSFHGTGEALDVAGTPAGMLGFFRYMKNTMGRGLAELIYTPGGAGVKNGSSFTYSGQVARDHYDHVHVAVDLPGVGDGIGKSDRSLIASAAQSGGIDPSILWGVWGAESNFSHGPGPVSRAGAIGPFQFMPETARGMGVNPRDLRSSAFGAARYLGTYKGRGVAGMLAAYNAGPGGNPNNAETQAYIPRVLAFAKKWAGSGSSRGGGGSGGSSKSKLPKHGSSVSSGSDFGGGYDPQAMYAEGTPHRTVTINGRRVRIPDPDYNPVYSGRGNSIKGISQEDADRLAAERADAAANAPTEFDYLDLALANAEATADKSDDQSALTAIRDYRARALAAASATGDPRQIAQARRDLTSAENALKELTDNTAALAEALEGVRSELKRNADIAERVRGTNEYQLTKTLSDLISGHIVGRGVVGRSFTPGTGVEYAY